MRKFLCAIGWLGLAAACASPATPTAVSEPAPAPTATAASTVTPTKTRFVTPTFVPSPTHVLPEPTQTPPLIPALTRTPVVPRRGDIIAETTEGKYIVIRHEGGEEEIDHGMFKKYARDAAVAVDHSFRLQVSDYHRILNVPLDSTLRSGGTVALGDRRKLLIERLVAVDILGLYGAAVQHHREVLLFEAIDAHHQGVIFTIPERFERIESIFWGTKPPRDRDILLVLRDVANQPSIHWLSPGAHIYEAPDWVRQECYRAPRLLTDCLMRYNRSLKRELLHVRDAAFHASVVW